jgi:general secretion pathway protein D
MNLIPPLSDNSLISKKSQDLINRFSPSEEVTVSVDVIQLSDFIHYIFKDLLNVNYVLDSKVPAQEKLSLNLQDRVTKQKLFTIVSDILAGYNTVVREKGGVYYIVFGAPQMSVEVGIGSTYNDVPDSGSQIRQLVPLRYVLANTLMQMLLSVPGLMAYVMPNENIIVVQGTREIVIQAMQIIEAMDRPAMRGKFGVMFKVSYWDTKDLVPKLKDILSQEGIPISMSAAEGGLRLISLERWRIILAFGAEKAWIDRLNYWVRTLDIPEDTDDKQFFLYFPENSRARDLEETIQNIFGLSSTKSKTGGKTRKSDSLVQGNQTGQPAVRPVVAPVETSSTETSAGGIPHNMATIADQVSVTVDENRNALVIYTTSMYYKTIESLLKQIDLMPSQVLIEATVAEVTLTGNLSYGMEWYIKRFGFDLTGDLNILKKTIGAGGLDYSLINDANTFKLLINALATDSKIKVLSSPRLTVRDGKTASMVVGTEVPVITGDVSNSTGVVSTGMVRSFQYRTTGITLVVTPTVHARGVLSMLITQGVSEPASNGTSGIDSPIILNRNITTEVIAADGQTIMLGGLIKENDSQTLTKVPWLGDIPILGNLFKNTSKGDNRTELVIMITPHIIRSPQQIEDMRAAILHNFQEITIEDDAVKKPE